MKKCQEEDKSSRSLTAIAVNRPRSRLSPASRELYCESTAVAARSAAVAPVFGCKSSTGGLPRSRYPCRGRGVPIDAFPDFRPGESQLI